MVASESRPRSSRRVSPDLIVFTSRLRYSARALRTRRAMSDSVGIVLPLWQEFLEDHRRIVAAESERVQQRHLDRSFLRLRGNAGEGAVGIRVVVVDRRVDLPRGECHRADDAREGARRYHSVTDPRFCRVDGNARGAALEQPLARLDLHYVA